MGSELGAIAVEMLGRRQIGRLELSPMDDKQRMPPGREVLDDGAADEPRPAEHRDPHAV